MNIEELRTDVDRINFEILKLLISRFQITEKIAIFKKQQQLTLHSPDRVNEMLNTIRTQILEQDASNEDLVQFILPVFQKIFETSLQSMSQHAEEAYFSIS